MPADHTLKGNNGGACPYCAGPQDFAASPEIADQGEACHHCNGTRLAPLSDAQIIARARTPKHHDQEAPQ